jgi:hypothetical protein
VLVCATHHLMSELNQAGMAGSGSGQCITAVCWHMHATTVTAVPRPSKRGAAPLQWQVGQCAVCLPYHERVYSCWIPCAAV